MSAWPFVLGFVATTTTSTTWHTDQILDTVHVEDTRIQPETADPSATATIVEARRLESARRRGEDVGDIVDQVPGVRVLDLGGPVAPRAVTIRGGAPAQSALVVDGVVMRTPFATGLDPTLVHPEAIRHLEVVRGGLGSTYGDGALTGALVIRTIHDEPRSSATLTVGSLKTARLSAMTTMLPIAIAASYERSDGRFTYVDRQPGLPDETFVRENNERERATLSLSTDHRIGDGHLWLRAGGSLSDSGTPGLANAPDISGEARDERRSGRASAVWRQTLPEGAAELRVSGYVLDLDYRDPPQEIASDTTLTAISAEGALELLWGGGQLARAEIVATREQAESSVFGDVDRGRLSLALTDEIEFGDVVVHAGARGVHVGPRQFHLLPRVGAVWTATTGFELVFGIGRALRTPAIDELFHPPEVGFSGNPDLVAETAWEVELSARYRRGLALSTTVFARRISNAILYLNRNAFVVRPENVGDADAVGGEVEVGGETTLAGFELDAMASGSLLFSRLAATGARLPTQPVFSYAGQLRATRWNVTLGTFLRGFSETFTRITPADDNVVRAYFRWDAALTVHPFEAWSLSAKVDNILDTRTLQTVNRFPLPGRTAFVTLRFVTD